MSQMYLLPLYANQKHINDHRTETGHESRINYKQGDIQIVIIETNSLTEDRYCLNLSSAKYEAEGNIIKEAMIHHHPKGHKQRHLQFKLKSRHEVIRIMLDKLDEEDYISCIKGFLYVTQRILKLESEEFGLDENIVEYFFNDEINTLESDRIFLLQKIKKSYGEGEILTDEGKKITSEKFEQLKEESHLLPFLEW